jgi:osmotically inducible lipoprotein OsmB
MRFATIATFIAGLFALSACGQTTEQQAATGALGGMAIGGIPGAAVGGAVGAVAGDEIRDAAN